MEIVYRSGKFCFSLKPEADSLKELIASLRVMAGDTGSGQCVSRTPETESLILKMAKERGILIQCQGIHRKAIIYLDSPPTQDRSASKNARQASLDKAEKLSEVQWHYYPLNGLYRYVYEELVRIEAARYSSAEETYSVLIKEYQKDLSPSEHIVFNVKADTWAKKTGVKL